MKILFISKELLGANLAYRMKQEGHDVKLYIEDKDSRKCFDYIVPKVLSWKKELNWVGKDGLIVFDFIGQGKIQDDLRKKGYKVFGGSELGEKLELDREFGQKIFSEVGMKTVPLKDFKNVEDAIIYANIHRNRWVIKQNNGMKGLSYIGQMKDGSDVISVLKNYLSNKDLNREKITLHERVEGIEIGIGRYFNGNDWVGPIEFNIEHSKFFPGDIGPTTSEMGTVIWYEDDLDNPLYKETIGRMKDFLKKADFRGDFEINCIVNESGIYPLEATARFGSPAVHLQDEIHSSPWGEFLMAVASGNKYDLKWKKGFGIVVLMAIPPFPYTKKIKELSAYGINIFFDGVSDEDMRHVHIEELSARLNDPKQLYIADGQGYILYVTGIADTIPKAQEKVYSIVKKIIIPKSMYRNDIGSKFWNDELAILKSMGFIK